MEFAVEQTKGFYTHLRDVVFERLHEKNLRDDFRKQVEASPFADIQLEILRDHASPTGKDCISGNHHRLWHTFSDAIKKSIMFIHMGYDDEIFDGLKDIAVFTQWNTDNYSMILGLDTSAKTVPYPAAKSDISTFPELLCYLHNSFLPAVKSHLAGQQNMTPDEIDAELDARAAALIEQGLPGIEIMRPIARENWASIPRPL